MSKSEQSIESIFEKWSQKTNIPVEEIKKRYQELCSQLSNTRLAFKKLRSEISDEYGSLFSPAVPFYGYFIGDSGLYDWVEMMREKAQRLYENPETRQKAIDDGIVNEAGEPLDTRKKLFGKDNPNYGCPLVGSAFERDLLAVVSGEPNFEHCKLAKVIATGDNASNLKEIELFKWYKFRATVGKSRKDDSTITLKVGAGTKFIEYNSNLKPEEIANKVEYFDVEPEILETIFNDKFNGKKTNYLASFRGDVGNLILEPINGHRLFYLISDSDDIALTRLKCRLPLNIPVVFRENETIQVFGRMWKDRFNKFGLDVKGYIPLGV